MDSIRASRLRQKISGLIGRRNAIEKRLFERRRMVRASFLVRYLGTKQAKRRTPAYYLSFRKEGRTVLKYVPSWERASVKARAEAWGEYVRLVAEWVRVCREIEKVWRALGEAQAEVVDGRKRL
jgi:hypothetical protein